jgi:hypothetical protein
LPMQETIPMPVTRTRRELKFFGRRARC